MGGGGRSPGQHARRRICSPDADTEGRRAASSPAFAPGSAPRFPGECFSAPRGVTPRTGPGHTPAHAKLEALNTRSPERSQNRVLSAFCVPSKIFVLFPLMVVKSPNGPRGRRRRYGKPEPARWREPLPPAHCPPSAAAGGSALPRTALQFPSGTALHCAAIPLGNLGPERPERPARGTES